MKPPNDLGFAHVFVPAEEPNSPTLLLLHGTGGDERDLLPLEENCGRELLFWVFVARPWKTACHAFFRRFAEGVFDVDDLKFRTEELAQFIDTASERYGFSREKLIVVGYSNGANIGSSLILLHPHYMAAAVLFRAMMPYTPDLIRDFSHLSVFIGAGRLDPLSLRPG